MSNQGYDRLKSIVTLVLPGVATFYMALAQFWDFPNPEAVVGSITALGTLLGLVLRSLSREYANQPVEYSGNIQVAKVEGHPIELMFVIQGQDQVEKIASQEEVIFKVNGS